MTMTALTLNRRLMLAGAAALFLAAAVVAPAAHAQDRAAYAGLKQTVAVDTFQATESVGGSVTADGMTALLIQALVADGRFVVIEGTASSEASAVVRGVVTKYEAAAGGSSLSIGGGLGSMLGGRAGTRSQRAVMEISLRLVDAATGQVVSTSRAQGSASSRTSDAGLVNTWTGATVGGEIFRATPIGQAGEDAIMRAVDQIAAGMRDVPWSALVVEAAEGGVYLNAGADRNVQPGLTLGVWRPGRTLTDPRTGEVLDVEMARVGQVRVETVRDRLSIASVVSGEPPMRGDVLKTD